MNKTIEQRIADIILDRDVSSIEIDGVTYPVGLPSIATLIMASEIISTIPMSPTVGNNLPKDVKSTEIVKAVLSSARNYKDLGKLAAVLILGAKNITETRIVRRPRFKLFGCTLLSCKTAVEVDRVAELGEKIMLNVTASQLWNLVLARINLLGIGDFFSITTSLSEINVLKPTREVEN